MTINTSNSSYTMKGTKEETGCVDSIKAVNLLHKKGEMSYDIVLMVDVPTKRVTIPWRRIHWR